MVFGWTSNTGPVAWYRVEQPLAALAQEGYLTASGMALPAELEPGARGNARLKDAAVYLGQHLGGVQSTPLWQELAKEGRRLFLEMDDDPWSIDRSNTSHAQLSNPGFLARLSSNLKVSNGVIVTRRPLAEVVRQHTDAPIYVIPNYVPAWLLEWTKPTHPSKIIKSDDSMARVHWRKNCVITGWAGSGHHSMDWEHYSGRFIQWVSRTPSTVLHVMGAPEYLGVHHREFPPGRVTVEGWNDGVEAFMKRICFDIAVLPLKRHPFNESKSWIAALIYGALGIPVVASDVGPYHDFIIHGQTGFLFATPGEMVQYLNYLVNDSELRADLGANARAVAAAHTYERNSWKWASVLCRDTEVNHSDEDFDHDPLAQ